MDTCVRKGNKMEVPNREYLFMTANPINRELFFNLLRRNENLVRIVLLQSWEVVEKRGSFYVKGIPSFKLPNCGEIHELLSPRLKALNTEVGFALTANTVYLLPPRDKK